MRCGEELELMAVRTHTDSPSHTEAALPCLHFATEAELAPTTVWER